MIIWLIEKFWKVWAERDEFCEIKSPGRLCEQRRQMQSGRRSTNTEWFGKDDTEHKQEERLRQNTWAAGGRYTTYWIRAVANDGSERITKKVCSHWFCMVQLCLGDEGPPYGEDFTVPATWECQEKHEKGVKSLR